MFSWSCVDVMGGIFTLGNFGATLGGETVSCFDASVGTCYCGWTVARRKIQLVGLTPAFKHCLCAYGASGAGLRRALISSVTVMVAFSSEDRNGIFVLCGRNSTVSGCITALVSGTYML